jgi:hypothetical protein
MGIELLKSKGEKDVIEKFDNGLDSEYEEVYINRIEEYSKKKMPSAGSGIIFGKAHKDGKYYFLNKIIQVNKDQINLKEIGEIVYNKWCEALN